MYWDKLTYVLCLWLGFAFCSSAFANNTAPKLVSPDQLVNTSITVNNRVSSIYCFKTAAGTIVNRSTGTLFTPFRFRVLDLQKKRARPQQIQRARELLNAGTKACRALSQLPAPTPTTSAPEPTPPNSPSPVPSPAPIAGNFLPNGDVTEQGKAVFGIPANLSANVERGKRVFQVYCVGCHSEKVNRSFDYLDLSIRRSPMLYDDSQLSRQSALPDLVAYLNRFRF